MDPVNNDPHDHHCDACGAVGTTCCATAQARLETLKSFEILTRLQSGTIKTLQFEVAEAYQVIADLRRSQKEAA